MASTACRSDTAHIRRKTLFDQSSSRLLHTAFILSSKSLVRTLYHSCPFLWVVWRFILVVQKKQHSWKLKLGVRDRSTTFSASVFSCKVRRLSFSIFDRYILFVKVFLQATWTWFPASTEMLVPLVLLASLIAVAPFSASTDDSEVSIERSQRGHKTAVSAI